EQHSAGANIAMFVTHGTPEDHEELPGWLQKCKDAAAGAKVAGFFDCQGELAEWVADMLKQSGDPKMAGYAEARPASIGQPDETRLERARAFARGVMGKQ
ncbi:MAG: flavodoxin, partial [Chloroflexota bacterium]